MVDFSKYLTGFFKKDTYTDATVIVQESANAVNLGNHYAVGSLAYLTTTATEFKLLFIAPTSGVIYLSGGGNSSQPGTLYLYEDATVTSVGTTIASFNNDRNSTNVATVKTSIAPTFDTTTNYGNMILAGVFGSDGMNPVGGNGGAGGITDRTEEMICKHGSKYLFRFVSEKDACRFNMTISFREYL